jgi:hypothetical protein
MNESATIEETVTRLVADIDWTDECEVLLHLRKRTTRLTPAQARQIASALTRSADAAERAADGAVRPVAPSSFDLLGQVTSIAGEIGATVEVEHLSPDCAAGKHPASWLDMAWDDVADVEVPCECSCHATGAAA